jgi:hypothetical protein
MLLISGQDYIGGFECVSVLLGIKTRFFGHKIFDEVVLVGPAASRTYNTDLLFTKSDAVKGIGKHTHTYAHRCPDGVKRNASGFVVLLWFLLVNISRDYNMFVGMLLLVFFVGLLHYLYGTAATTTTTKSVRCNIAFLICNATLESNDFWDEQK